MDLPPDGCCSGCARARSTSRSRPARDRALLPQGQPDRAARAGAAPHGRARGRADARLHGASSGDRETWAAASGCWSASARARARPAGAGRAAHGGAAARRLGRGVRGDAARPAAERRRARGAASRPLRAGGAAGRRDGDAERAERRATRSWPMPESTTSPGSWWASRAAALARALLGSLLDALVRGSGDDRRAAPSRGEEERRQPRRRRRRDATGTRSSTPGPRPSWWCPPCSGLLVRSFGARSPPSMRHALPAGRGVAAARFRRGPSVAGRAARRRARSTSSSCRPTSPSRSATRDTW